MAPTDTDDKSSPFFDEDDAALLLIDHQTGLLQGVENQDTVSLRNNVLALAEVAKLYDLPVVLTTSRAEGPNGPLLPKLNEMFPEVEVIDRSLVNAWDDPAFVEAVEATGRSNLIMAGILTEVCVAFPAISAAQEGYNVQAVLDASGSLNDRAEQAAMSRMEQAGVDLTSWFTVSSEMLKDWTKEVAPEQAAHFSERTGFYELVLESFNASSAE
ncbi:hydrolase (plasmid) [Haloferax mediterranei ATCC 33500]|uniref:Hydrolase n=1 Tax=Haloferax mediterranei (strain ATCC 33500 / DSM 1411 / JCM 8866 / NBRC 14739 / NCIMB 2177 / R-4) TaxID=523841 RepID=I3RBJ7_HALMT|nr:hydrolase [Haloferax mediterranei]AFK21607.1 nicotinamidase-like amidase [Haloferax mediterranei ATCC 33500]ELZ97083.1 nicotinamidase-like amidase [Haloferax mediterranei ATCC 33500]MDX5990170.1 hydrolase [Haloferax mediterranei ATCC 33500]QCQ76755.1 hydrolase [Haloferax mediterranei ATCC 33500]